MLGVIGKPDDSFGLAQSEAGCEIFQRGNCGLIITAVRGLNDHNAICVNRLEHLSQGVDLHRFSNIPLARPTTVVNQLIILVKQFRKPFNVIGSKTHQASLWVSLISSQALLIAIIRLVAMVIASSGRPRAII